MERKDLLFIIVLVALFLPFFVSPGLYMTYKLFNQQHGMVMSFVKFGFLATLGEIIGQRIRTGNYFNTGFGLLPRFIVWGLIGMTINMAFIIFSTGTPFFIEYLGLKNASEALTGPMNFDKVLVAFSTSTAMNIIYAPVMMTFHKITDTHIIANGGTLSGFFTPIPFRKIFINLNWDVQWNFVFKKTIPFFWIPAHTITFLLPADFRVLFAALLGMALGTILAIANTMKNN
jgi:hypothetical protein